MDKHSVANGSRNPGRDDKFVDITIFNFIIDSGKHFDDFLNFLFKCSLIKYFRTFLF